MAIRATAAATKAADKYAKYASDPDGFARDVLKFEFTALQKRMAEGLIKPPYRVLALSANEQGKTAGAAAVVLWWFLTRQPAIIITTAPKFDQVKKLLWKEIRRLAKRAKLPLPFQPRACHIERSPEDFATGTTARDATSFQGHHGPNQLFIFDEGTGIDPEFFESVESMFSPPGHAWLVIFNPTTTSAQVFIEYSRAEADERGGKVPPWLIVRMSALDHPNIDAELKGNKPPIPHAMRVDKFERLLKQWSTLTGADPNKPVGSELGPEPNDVVWPPVWAKDYCEKTGQVSRVYRPGPEAESRLLARFPSQGSTSVWGDGDWMAACRELPGMEPLPEPGGETLGIPEIGADIARFGDDKTELHTRCECVSLTHESASKRPVDQTAGRIIELARWLADWYNARKAHLTPRTEAEQIPIKIDDDGVGGGVSDILIGKGFNVTRIGAGTNANDTERYPNKRSELCFVTAERARRGEMDLSRLPSDALDELRRQALTLKWSLDSDGRRVVMPKDKMKSELGRSPDSVDALNLSYFNVGSQGPSTAAINERKGPFGR